MEGIVVIIYLAVVVGTIAGMWQTFVKAGRPGWEAIIPIYNIWILVTKIEQPGKDKEVLHLVLCLIPCVSIIGWVIVNMGVAERFGKERSFGILSIFSFIYFPILGFGDARYTPPVNAM